MKFGRRLIALFRKEKLDADMAEEMRVHLELQAAENEKRGLSVDEARYAAQRSFGGEEQIKERVRDARGFGWLEDVLQDLRYGARQLRRNPGFTTVVALTLALGIGINTVVFTFYGAVALKPLAVRAPEEIARIVTVDRGAWNDAMAYGEFEDIRDRAQSFTAVVVTSEQQVFTAMKPGAGAGPREVVVARLVSDNYFSALGVAPVLGRGFGAGDSAAGILSHDAWERRFHADPTVLGQTLLVQDVAVTIVGVAPKEFGGTGRPNAAPDLWLPLGLQPALLPTVDWRHDATMRPWQVLARRKANVSPAQASAELDVLGRTWPRLNGQPVQLGARKATLFEVDGPEFKAMSAVLMFAVGLILLIAGVNVVNLLSARNAAREHELAVRLSLGASRRRLVRQLCTESLLLGLLGGVGGLALSAWACGLIRAVVVGEMQTVIPGGVWRVFLDVTPDWRVFAYTTAVASLAGIGVGLWPAWRATGPQVQSALKQDASGLGRAARGPWSRRNLLLTTQVALCLVLLAGAGLLFRGATHAFVTEPGFDSKRLLVMARVVPESAAPTLAGRERLLREVVARTGALPEVTSVAWADRVPYLGHGIRTFETDDRRWIEGCVTNWVSANYLETLGVPLVDGRSFTIGEQESRASVVIISESAARNLWPGKDPLGRRIIDSKRNHDGSRDTFTVIGVAKDARVTLLSQTDAVDLFFPQPLPVKAMLLVRTRAAPEAAFQSVFATLRDVDAILPTQALVMTMDGGPMKLQRLLAEGPATFASLLGGLALVLASVGIYGVVSFVVARRTREIGIHLALGAQKGDVVRLVLRQTLQPVGWGAALGLAGAVALSVLIARLVLNPEVPDLTYGAGAFPSVTLLGVLGLLLGVILLAAFIPARRATKVDPMVALRAE